MERVEYPFVKCLRPRLIVNPYTGKTILVPCNHCKACLNRKASANTLKCDLEAKCCTYTMFVSMTYSPEYLPTMIPVYHEKECYFDLVHSSTGEILGTSRLTRGQMRKLLYKFNIKGLIPILEKRDLQLFLKRFRKQVYSLYHEKVRYYAVGEYGPVHYRPHYHLLLFFNSKELASNFAEIICKAWPFGSVNFSLAEDNASSYVSGYVNSNFNVPSLLQAFDICPFSTHSFFLGFGHFSYLRNYVYELPPSDIITQSIVLKNHYTEFRLWSSFLLRFFPKCKGFCSKDTLQRNYSYQLYNTAKEVYALKELPNCMEVAKWIYNDVAQGKHLQADFQTKDFGLYFYQSYPFARSLMDDDVKQSIINGIYSELCISKLFLEYVCDNCTVYEINRKNRLIDEFWSYVELSNLNNMYERMEYWCDDVGTELIPCFYDNYNEKLPEDNIKESILYRMFLNYSEQRFRNSIKHKELNDRNNIFNNL